MENKLVFPELSYELVGLFYATHNQLGRYANEKQYADFLEELLKKNKLRYEREKILDKFFPGERAGRHRIDFLIENKVVIELKCVRFVSREEYFQTRRYLKVTGKKLAFIVNFREKFLRPRRILNPDSHDDSQFVD